MKKLVFPLTFMFSCTAFAHHPLNSMPMESFSDGLLSGVGHTIIGIDHFFFVAIVGLIGLFTGHKYTAPLAYMAAMVAGCLMMAAGLNLPYKESVTAISLLTLGLFVLAGIRLTLIPALTLFIVFGIFHGSAFGETIAANEITLGKHILYGYLTGLAAFQYLIALACGWFVENLLNARDPVHINVRLSGAFIAGIGLLLTLESLEGTLLKAFI